MANINPSSSCKTFLIAMHTYGNVMIQSKLREAQVWQLCAMYKHGI